MRDQTLSVAIEDGEVVIRIGINTLQAAVEACPDLERMLPEGLQQPTVIDPEAFAREVVDELLREEEDGTTIVHRMFDHAFLAAVENGAEGIAMPVDEAHGGFRLTLTERQARALAGTLDA